MKAAADALARSAELFERSQQCGREGGATTKMIPAALERGDWAEAERLRNEALALYECWMDLHIQAYRVAAEAGVRIIRGKDG